MRGKRPRTIPHEWFSNRTTAPRSPFSTSGHDAPSHVLLKPPLCPCRPRRPQQAYPSPQGQTLGAAPGSVPNGYYQSPFQSGMPTPGSRTVQSRLPVSARVSCAYLFFCPPCFVHADKLAVTAAGRGHFRSSPFFDVKEWVAGPVICTGEAWYIPPVQQDVMLTLQCLAQRRPGTRRIPPILTYA